MIYITYKEHNIGGLGHSLCDWLSCYILSKILNYPFIFEKLPVWSNQNRSMDVNNSNNKYFWNDELNLDKLNTEKLNVVDSNNLNLSDFKRIPIKIKSFEIVEINKFKTFIEINNKKYKNIIYYLDGNTRIYLRSLLEYDNINNTQIRTNIINDLNNVYYLKHKKLDKEKK